MQLFIPWIVVKDLDGNVKAPVFVMSLEDGTESSRADAFPIFHAISTHHLRRATSQCHVLLNSVKRSTHKNLNDFSKGARLQLFFVVFHSPLGLSCLENSHDHLLTNRRENMMKQAWRGGTVGGERGSNFSTGTLTAQVCSSTTTPQASVIALLLRCLCFVIFPIDGGDFTGLTF